jgi:hypothetical protein
MDAPFEVPGRNVVLTHDATSQALSMTYFPSAAGNGWPIQATMAIKVCYVRRIAE